MQFIDSHIHLQDYKTNNAQQIIEMLKKADIVKAICVSAKIDDWKKIATLAEAGGDLIIPAFGCHPWYIENLDTDWKDKLEQYLQKYPSAQIGECGIDRLRGIDVEQQIGILKEHLLLANKHNRAVNLHMVKAEDIFLSLKKELPKRVIIHSFGGSISFLQALLKTNVFFSINPRLRQKRNFADLIRQIPLDRILTESDAPYQAQLSDIADLAQQMAQIYNISALELTQIIIANFKRLCR